MADKARKPGEVTVDKATGEPTESAGDALDDQTTKAQGTIGQKDGARKGASDGPSRAEESTDKTNGE